MMLREILMKCFGAISQIGWCIYCKYNDTLIKNGFLKVIATTTPQNQETVINLQINL